MDDKFYVATQTANKVNQRVTFMKSEQKYFRPLKYNYTTIFTTFLL